MAQNTPYGRIAMGLHWVIAVLLLAQFAFGWWLGDIARGTPARGYFINLHKSTGIIIGLLILLRLWWRIRHVPPELPASMASWQKRLAMASHKVMYGCMVLMPLSGYTASNFSRHGVKLFNAVTMPAWGPDNKAVYAFFNQVHKSTALVLMALILLHVAVAVWHAARHDGIFSRMWPHRG